MIILKQCTSCGKERPVSEFRKQSKNKDGLKYTCITCDDKRARKRYKLNRESITDKVRDWQAKNPNKVKAYKQKYREGSLDNTGQQDH